MHSTSGVPLSTGADCTGGESPALSPPSVDKDEAVTPPSCSLVSAVLYLHHALQTIERMRKNASGSSPAVASSLLLHRLEEDALLRLTYALLQLGRLHEGLETARRLDLLTQSSAGADISQNR